MKKITRSPFDPFVQRAFPKLLPLVPRWMSANLISVIGILCSLAAGVFLVLGTKSVAFWVLGGVLVLATWVTDTLDGFVARDRKQLTLVGHYLDHFGDSLAVLFIGMGLFMTNGSHYEIGLASCVIYLLYQVDGHIKVNILNTLELPAFGPTEIRFVIFSAIMGQAFIDFGKPLSWFPEITGETGWLVRFLGLETGLTFIDVCGLIVALFAFLGIFVEFAVVIRRLRAMDRAGKGAA